MAFLDAPQPKLSITMKTKNRSPKTSVLNLLAWSGRAHAPAAPARDTCKSKPSAGSAAPAEPAGSTSINAKKSAAAAAAAAAAEPAKPQQLRGIATLLGRLRDSVHAVPGPDARAKSAPKPQPATHFQANSVDHQGVPRETIDPAPDTAAVDDQLAMHMADSGHGAGSTVAAAAAASSSKPRRTPFSGLLAAVRRLGGGRARKTAPGVLPRLLACNVNSHSALTDMHID